jgi:hypothetical protein
VRFRQARTLTHSACEVFMKALQVATALTLAALSLAVGWPKATGRTWSSCAHRHEDSDQPMPL